MVARCLLVAAILAALWLTGSHLFSTRPEAAPGSRNVVLITVDTLRPDRLGCYGGARPTSQNIDSFREQCVLFHQAYSTSSFTPPSHASLLTSQYVGEHGLLTWNELPEDRVTLAEVLRGRGYRTGASVSINLLSAQNLDQGFDWRKEDGRNAEGVVQHALEFLRRDPGEPFFLWLHYYDVHRPYARQDGWKTRFSSHAPDGVGDVEEHYNLTAADIEHRGLTGDDLAFIEERYDAGIAGFDAAVAPLLAELSGPPHAEDTLVILTADHGENLREHPEVLFSHDPFLFRTVTWIPLLVRYPGGTGAGTACDTIVSLIDLAPTTLDVLGVESPASFRGQSLQPLLHDAVLARSAVFMECWGWETKKAVRSVAGLVIHDYQRGRREYYDLPTDPGELRPRDTAATDELAYLSVLLDRFAVGQGEIPESPALSAEVLQTLRDLGYLR